MVIRKIESASKETEVGIIPSDWVIKELSDVTNIIDSLHQTPSFVDFGYAMVRATEIKAGNLNLEKTARVDKKTYAEFTRKYRPVKGDIVLSRVGTYIGVNSFVDTDEPFCMGQNTVVIHPLIVGKFLYYILNSENVREQIDNESYGTSGQKSLSLKNIKELKLPVPNTESEQSNIAQILTNVDDLIESLDKLIEKKKNIKQGAMEELLTGKKRLPGFSEEWTAESLSKVGDITMGQSPPGNSYTSNCNDIPLINGAAELTEKGILITKYTSAPTRFSKTGDLLFCIRATIGNLQVSDKSYCLGRGVAGISVYENYDSRFIAYKLIELFEVMKQQSEGGVIKGLRKDELADLELRRPDKMEQHAIAQVLSDMDMEIEELEQKRNKYKQLKTGMMQQLLTGRIRLKWKN